MMLQVQPQVLALPDAEIRLYRELFGAGESQRFWQTLQTQIAWRQDKIRMFGRSLLLPRLTAWYGDPGAVYSYSGIRLEPQGWAPVLLEIKQRVEATVDCQFNSVLLNFYRDGQDSMGWHSDDEPELGLNPVIASVSFGGSRRFHLRHRQDKTQKAKLDLTNGSLLLMAGPTQHYWQHQIPKMAQAEARINLTFRWIHSGKDQGNRSTYSR
jgi:alkylated DNA repair dioxygenase AlkB